METLLRREFLARSALGGAALLGADRLACGAEGVRAANVAEEQLGEFDPEAPSNALVTGVDPDEMVLFAFASANLDSWQEAGIMSFHRPESQPGIHRGRQVHVGASIWHRRNVLLGLYGQWVGPENNLHPDVRMNLGLIISNDGLRYREPVPDYPFIRWRSEQSDWKTLRLLQGQGFVNHGGRTYIFYGAGSGEEVPVANHCMVGLATLPRDRFRHLQPRGSGAMCITNTLPAISRGARLAVNADGLGTDARLRVEALDHRFQPIVGHAGESAASVRNSGLRESINWPTGGDAVPADRPWRLRVYFEGDAAETIRLYALYIKPAKS